MADLNPLEQQRKGTRGRFSRPIEKLRSILCETTSNQLTQYRRGTPLRCFYSYVNQYTGNLVWVHEDLGFGGNRMPVSINHVYNANDNAITRFGTGVGWRTNFNQRVFVWSKNENYYVWEDADGTDHYFLYDSANTYKDEDGLELTLTTGGSGSYGYGPQPLRKLYLRIRGA